MTHIHLPELPKLKKSIESNPSLLNYYTKIEAWIGTTESVRFLEKVINENS